MQHLQQQMSLQWLEVRHGRPAQQLPPSPAFCPRTTVIERSVKIHPLSRACQLALLPVHLEEAGRSIPTRPPRRPSSPWCTVEMVAGFTRSGSAASRGLVLLRGRLLQRQIEAPWFVEKLANASAKVFSRSRGQFEEVDTPTLTATRGPLGLVLVPRGPHVCTLLRTANNENVIIWKDSNSQS